MALLGASLDLFGPRRRAVGRRTFRELCLYYAMLHRVYVGIIPACQHLSIPRLVNNESTFHRAPFISSLLFQHTKWRRAAEDFVLTNYL